MDDYISREAALEQFKQLHGSENDLVNIYNADWIVSFIESLPSADVRPLVRGEWKNAHPSSPMHDGGGRPYCSACGKEAPLRSVEIIKRKLVGGRISVPEVVYSEETYFSDFCPNCGADMRQKGEENV